MCSRRGCSMLAVATRPRPISVLLLVVLWMVGATMPASLVAAADPTICGVAPGAAGANEESADGVAAGASVEGIAKQPEEQPAEQPAEEQPGWLERLELDPGGHLRLRERASWPADGSALALADDPVMLDTAAELRLKTTARLTGSMTLDLHYEALLDQGDTRALATRLGRYLSPDVIEEVLGAAVDDRRRLLDLTSEVDSGGRHRLIHRIDRLALRINTSWGTVVAGRQALTWGNGLVFNPMDLFNPFAPTDVERDYKIGDDMLVATAWLDNGGELQALAVPRRDPISGDLEWGQSSVAVKMHRVAGSIELDMMAARHYEDHVAGVGMAGYLGSAAWRSDMTWTFLHDRGGIRDSAEPDGFLSAVLNLDYSWVWSDKNWYGFVELYYNGLGQDDPLEALAEPALAERLARGELYTSGRSYAAASTQYEVHPLVNLYLTVIHNLGDGSGLVQPRITWDMDQNLQLVAGADLPYGGRGTELGGFELPGLGYTTEQAPSAYCWLSWFF